MVKLLILAMFVLSCLIYVVPAQAGSKINCDGTMTDYERSNCERRNSTDRDTPAEKADKADDGKKNGSTGKGKHGRK